MMRPRYCGFGARSAARSSRKTCRAIWWSSLGPRLRTSTGTGIERNTNHLVTAVQRHVRHPVNRWMGATLDGMVEGTGAVFEAKFMLPWSFSEEAAAEKHMAQLQHNMLVAGTKKSVLSIITGGGKSVEITIPMDPLYLSVLVSAEKKFWRCVESGERPRVFGVEPPRA